MKKNNTPPEDDDEDDEEFGSNEEFLNGPGNSLSKADKDFLSDIDPLDKEKLLEADYDRAKTHLLNDGYDEDEMKVMFPDREDLIKFYSEKRKGMHIADGEISQQEVDKEANEGPEPEDDYELDDAATQAYLPGQKLAKATPPAPPTKKDDKKKK